VELKGCYRGAEQRDVAEDPEGEERRGEELTDKGVKQRGCSRGWSGEEEGGGEEEELSDKILEP
jgi:hypothetical protein